MKLTSVMRWLLVAGFIPAAVATGETMQTPGELEVGSNGSAIFSVPLRLPPATGPEDVTLSLVYDSTASNGLFGVGWSLKGLSSINRCPKNIAEDGVRAGVHNDASDLYCFNGEKLRAVSGAYGADGTQYRTANESYARITSVGSSGAGPAWFRVELKDGHILELGNTEDSKLKLPSAGTVRVWMVSSSHDRSINGNVVSYVYEKNESLGEQVLLSMQHSNAFVGIEYEARPAVDAINKYVAGNSQGSTSRRAKTIRVNSFPLVAGVPTKQQFKEYRLGYQLSGATQRSLLQSITECGTGAQAASCLPAMQFEYSNAAGPATLAQIASPGPGKVPLDARGNGVPEFFEIHDNIMPFQHGQNISLTHFKAWDHNSDGRVDLLARLSDRNGDFPSVVLASSGAQPFDTVAPFGTGMYWCHGDYDGDGRTDAISDTPIVGNPNQPEIWQMGTWVSGSFANQKIGIADPYWLDETCTPVDVDGDGRSEIATFGQDSLVIYSVNVTSTGVGIQPIYGAPLQGRPKGIRFGDFNGDGNTDLIQSTGISLNYTISNGNLFNPLSVQSTVGVSISCIADFNGDGRSDIYDAIQGYFWLSTGVGFVSQVSGVPPINAVNEFVCEDFNGGGRAGVYNVTSGQLWVPAAAGPIDQLTGVKHGAGHTSVVEYKSIVDSSVYTKGGGSTYPRVDVQSAEYVVSRKLTSNGRGGFAPISYTYMGLRKDMQRNGMLGFEQVTSADEVTGVKVRTTYRQDPPFDGLVAQVQKFAGPILFEVSSHSFQAFDQTAQYARVHEVGTEIQRWNLDGSFVDRVRQTGNDFDLYGNSRRSVVEHLDQPGSNVMSRRTTSNEFQNDVGNWLIGQLTSTSTYSQVSGAAIPAATGTVDLPAILTFSSCLIDSPVSPPRGASMVCTLANTGQAGALSINYAASAGATATGPTTCPAGSTNCGIVKVTTDGIPGTYAGSLTATPVPGGRNAVAGYMLVVGPPSVVFQPVQTNWGVVGAASDSGDWPLIKNVSTFPIQLVSHAAANGPSGVWSWQGTNGYCLPGTTVLAPGESCQTFFGMGGLATPGSYTAVDRITYRLASGSSTTYTVDQAYTFSVGTSTIDSAGTAWPEQTVNTSSDLRSFTVTNNALNGGSLKNLSVAVTGAQASNFPISTNCGTTLAAGASCTVAVYFRPTAFGAFSADILVQGSYSRMQGGADSGLVSATVVNLAFHATGSGSGAALTLGNCTSTTPVTSPSQATMVCVLGNTGPSAATTLSYSYPSGVVGDGPSSCAANTTNCGNVALASGSAPGIYSGTFTISPPKGSGASVSINLTVNPTPPKLTFACFGNFPTVTPNPATFVCTVGNDGQTTATSINYTGPQGTSVSGPQSCAAGSTNCGTVTVTSDIAPGTYSGTLIAIPTPSGTAASVGANLTVKALALPAIAITPASWSFGSVKEGVVKTQVLGIENTNAGEAGPIWISSSNARFTILPGTCPANGGVMPAHTACTVTVQFIGEARCGGSVVSIPTVISVKNAAQQSWTSTGSAADWVYKLTDPPCR
ncbi:MULTISPECIES: choice-of-anchor D domain-containing protein [unclassified Rhizobacter]|uniref:choice-of-anchor D domain-containing protein n=1 Tax=unclassified Rhizobacter TaxID=2640088 RepID=UPI0012F76EF1|nr:MULTISPECIES: choice-of-anchor D domain-containing protein [unclassified Rhizobacter]